MIEKHYASIINKQTNEVRIGVGCTEDFYKEIGMTEMYVEMAENGKWYVANAIPEVITEDTKHQIENRIIELKQLLSDSNDQIIECMECKLLKIALPYDLKELHNQRQMWRDEISELTSKLS